MTENADATANTNLNEAPATAPVEAPAPTPTEPTTVEQPKLDLTPEQIEQFNKFMNANGGFDSAFSKVKTAISNPQPEPAQPSNSNNSSVENHPVQPVQPEQPKVQEGYATPQELIAEQYFNNLANNEKYASIADEIRNGEVLKKMNAEFGITPINSQGQINVAQVKNYLDMYAATKPAVQTSTAPTNIPTVDFVSLDNINSKDEALTVIKQSMDARLKGLAEHPMKEAAEKFLKENIFK